MSEEKTTKATETARVDEYMKTLDHPLKELSEAIRKVILSAHPELGEEIKWNAPSFFFTGPLSPFAPKEYKRVVVNFNYFKRDCIRLIFLKAGALSNESGLLEGAYEDGRRLAQFHSFAELENYGAALKTIVRQLVLNIGK